MRTQRDTQTQDHNEIRHSKDSEDTPRLENWEGVVSRGTP